MITILFGIGAASFIGLLVAFFAAMSAIARECQKVDEACDPEGAARRKAWYATPEGKCYNRRMWARFVAVITVPLWAPLAAWGIILALKTIPI